MAEQEKPRRVKSRGILHGGIHDAKTCKCQVCAERRGETFKPAAVVAELPEAKGKDRDK